MNIRLVLGIVVMITLGTAIIATPILQQQQSAYARQLTQFDAPVAISGDNVYVAWWTNKTANNNEEVLFRASADGGATFGNKTNLSNTTGAESQDVEIAAEGGNVVVTWWERNQTANEPVARISTNNGDTFGPVLNLATNGTIGEAAGEEEVEEEGE
jgi:hypothetical protein